MTGKAYLAGGCGCCCGGRSTRTLASQMIVNIFFISPSALGRRFARFLLDKLMTSSQGNQASKKHTTSKQGLVATQRSTIAELKKVVRNRMQIQGVDSMIIVTNRSIKGSSVSKDAQN